MIAENNLKRLLFEKDMNISTLSRATHISRSTLTDILKGRKTNITFAKASVICECLGCSMDELFPKFKSA